MILTNDRMLLTFWGRQRSMQLTHQGSARKQTMLISVLDTRERKEQT